MTAPRSDTRAPARPLRTALIGGAVAALMMSPLAASADHGPESAEQTAASGEVTDLGVAMSSINVRLSAVGELAAGEPEGYLVSDGKPVSLGAVGLCTGHLTDQH